MPNPSPTASFANPSRRAVVGVVVREARLLVIRRSLTVRAPGAFCFPGGGIDADEDEPTALAREFLEELGVTVRPMRRLWQSVTPWGVQVDWWRAALPRGQALRPNAAEVAETHWLSTTEMRALPDLLPSNQAFLDALQAGQFTLDDA